jgi:hypothetical protein
VVGAPVEVHADATDADVERHRTELEATLQTLEARAFAVLGRA